MPNPNIYWPLVPSTSGKACAEKKTWAEKYGSLVTAIFSLFVAALSLWLAITAQDRDAAYKELQIEPFLAFLPDDLNLNLRLTNSGLGPARIRRIVVSFPPDACFDTQKIKPAEIDSTLNTFKDRMASYVLADIVEKVGFGNLNGSFPASSLVRPNELIPGQDHGVTILGMARQASANSPVPVPPAMRTAASQIFRDKLRSLNMMIEYCSMTGKFCGSVQEGNPICK